MRMVHDSYNWNRLRKPQNVIVLLFCALVVFWIWYDRKEDYSLRTCRCEDSSKKQRTFDFCYRLPENQSIQGIPFDCKFLPILRKLKLIGQNRKNFSLSPTHQLVFVTAFSENHAGEGLRQLKLHRKLFPSTIIYVYDLGLSSSTRRLIEKFCFVIVRTFDFEEYPIGSNLREYRWKALIIAEVLRDHPSIWYLDSSVNLKTTNLTDIYDQLKCYYKSNSTCQKSSYLLHSFTGHGIFTVTNPGVYKFLPANFDVLSTESARMYEAGFVYAVRSPQSLEILKWYVLCALEPECIAPPGAGLRCGDMGDRYSKYANCHRFDQSVINLLLFNQFNHTTSRYISGIDKFFAVERAAADRSVSVEDMHCS